MFKFEFPSEKAFEDYVWHHIQKHKECPVSGEEVTIAYRQPALSGYGIADIIKVYVSNCEINVSVLELKNEPLKESHVSQVAKYMTALDHMLRQVRRLESDYFYVNLVAQLAGPCEPDRNDFVYLLNCLRDVEVYDVGVSMEAGFHSQLLDKSWYSQGRRMSDRTKFREDASKAYKEVLKAMAEFEASGIKVLPWEDS